MNDGAGPHLPAKTSTMNLLEAAQAALDRIPFLEADLEAARTRIAEMESELAKRPDADTFARATAEHTEILAKAHARIETLDQLRDTLLATNERTAREREQIAQDLRAMQEARDSEARSRRDADREKDALAREIRESLCPVLERLAPGCAGENETTLLRTARGILIAR